MKKKNLIFMSCCLAVLIMIGGVLFMGRGNKEKKLIKDIVKTEQVKQVSVQHKLENVEIKQENVDVLMDMLSKCECTLEADEEMPKGWIYRIRFDESEELTIISGELVSYNNKLYSVEGMDIELIDEVTGITRQ